MRCRTTPDFPKYNLLGGGGGEEGGGRKGGAAAAYVICTHFRNSCDSSETCFQKQIREMVQRELVLALT